MADQAADVAALRRERDLYRRLLDLGEVDDLEVLLREALALIVEATAAEQGYVELEDDVRRAMSRGIVAEAIASGHVVVTPSAQLALFPAAAPAGAEPTFQEAARRLDMARSHLYKLIRAFGLGRA